jgi:hypothetical protein
MEIFDRKLLEEAIVNFKPPRYTIGIDTYDKNTSAYCLIKRTGDITEILLCKTLNKEEFKEELNIISKYFNAEIISEIK